MTPASRHLFTTFLIGVGLASCSGSGGPAPEEPLNVDYSTLRIAESRDAPLVYARNDEDLLRPLRNGLRLMVGQGALAYPTATASPSLDAQTRYSSTTVQVDGVDEADAVKYDGRHIFTARPEVVPASPTTPQLSRNVLSIARTNSQTAAVEPVGNYVLEGEQSAIPQLYQIEGQDGAAQSLVAVSQNYQAWTMPELPLTTLVIHPDRTTVQVLDVRDPANVSQVWKLEMDGWMRASRLAGDTLYIVSSYRPRLPDLLWPADTLAKREANERRIRSSSPRDLLPSYSVNGGARQTLTSRDGCLVAQQIETVAAYTDLIVISAINLRTLRVSDVNCLSTNINAVYVSRQSLYVAGSGIQTADNVPITVLHKFSIAEDDVTYRATGAVVGNVGWSNPSYFMDEHGGDLRILTTTSGMHRLTILRESASQRLTTVAWLPNPNRPEPIGKPGEAVFAVRFLGERAYVVTFRVIDPLYVIDLRDPAEPLIAGELEIPGFSTYLQPLGPPQSQLLFAVGQEMNGTVRSGIKVELFDVRDIANPRSLGVQVIGGAGSFTEALYDPHALSFLALPGERYRAAFPVEVFDGPWQYSGLHLFEVSGGTTPQLRFQGVLKTDQPTGSSHPAFGTPHRGVLHDDSVFAIRGERIVSSLWQEAPAP